MQKNTLKKILLSLFLLTNLSVALACPQFDAKASVAIKAALKKNLPELSVDQINKTPINGLYEVISGRKVFYVDATGNYAVLGNLVDLSTKKSLTEAKTQLLSKVDWSKLPLDIAIKQVIGDGSRKLVVFTDPDCPFCKRLEIETVSKLKDVTIYYFLFPLPMHSDAANKSKKILCSQNPEKALFSWLKDEKALPNNMSCKNAAKLEQMINTGKNVVQVDATPMIVLENGNVLSGLIPADYLNKLMTDAMPVAPKSDKVTASESAMAIPGK